MFVAIAKEPHGATVLTAGELEEPVLHVECQTEVRVLDTGKVQCLQCMKTGWPISA
jgi:hypothetical protein